MENKHKESSFVALLLNIEISCLNLANSQGRNHWYAPSQNCEKLCYVCPSVWPHGTTRLPLDGFS
jgi:hypothetical protein